MKAGLLLLAWVSAAAIPAEGPVVTVGKHLEVSAPVAGRVISVGGSLLVRSRVGGDVVSWGGDVALADGGEVGGDLIVFGGNVSGAEGRVRGRVLTPGSLAAIYLMEARQAPWSDVSGARPAAYYGMRLFALAIWLAAAAAILRLFGSGVARTALCFEESPAAAAAAGILSIVVLFLAGVTVFAALPPAAGTPAALLILAAAAALKIFGMAGFFLFVGQRLSRRTSAAGRPVALTLGLLFAGFLSLVPVAGPVLWSAFSVLAVGAAAYTRFGSPRFRVAVA